MTGPFDTIGTEEAKRVEARLTAAAVLLLTGLAVARVFLVSTLELQGDEAYYWLWSKHLDIGYYSKGPGIAWTIFAGTAVFGDTPLGIRFPAVLLSLLAGLMLFALARRLYDVRTAFWTVVLSATVPLFAAGGLLMTIDPLSVTCWLAAALTFWRAVHGGGPGAWLSTGAFVGLGMLCKFTNLAQFLSFLVFCLWSRDARRHLARPGFWLMIATALVCLAPVLIWNARHDWITLQHLSHRGALDQAFRPKPLETLEFLGNQAAVLSPFYFVGLIWAFVRRDWIGGRVESWRYLVSLVAPLVVGYTLVSLNGEWEANWTAPALAVCPILLVAAWRHFTAQSRALRVAAAVAMVVTGLLIVAAHVAVLTPQAYGETRFRRLGGAEDLSRKVRSAQLHHGANFIITGGYQLSSLLSFYLPGRPAVYLADEGGMRNQFSFWPGYRTKQPEGAIALYVNKSPNVPDVFATQFQSVTPVGEVWSTYKGRNLRKFHLYLCRGLHRAPESNAQRSTSNIQRPTPDAQSDSVVGRWEFRTEVTAARRRSRHPGRTR